MTAKVQRQPIASASHPVVLYPSSSPTGSESPQIDIAVARRDAG